MNTNISTTELLAYTTILENIITTNNQLINEAKDGIIKGFATENELEPIVKKCAISRDEAKGKYEEIQKELDMRMKRDLKMKMGIRKTQDTIREFDTFVFNKNNEIAEKQKETLEAIEEISKETIANMEVIKNDEHDSIE